MNTKWTPEEIKILKKEYPIKNGKYKLSELLNKNVRSIETKAKSLKIKTTYSWQKQELEDLRIYAPIETDVQIQQRFKPKSLEMIKRKIRNMNIKTLEQIQQYEKDKELHISKLIEIKPNLNNIKPENIIFDIKKEINIFRNRKYTSEWSGYLDNRYFKKEYDEIINEFLEYPIESYYFDNINLLKVKDYIINKENKQFTQIKSMRFNINKFFNYIDKKNGGKYLILAHLFLYNFHHYLESNLHYMQNKLNFNDKNQILIYESILQLKNLISYSKQKFTNHHAGTILKIKLPKNYKHNSYYDINDLIFIDNHLFGTLVRSPFSEQWGGNNRMLLYDKIDSENENCYSTCGVYVDIDIPTIISNNVYNTLPYSVPVSWLTDITKDDLKNPIFKQKIQNFYI